MNDQCQWLVPLNHDGFPTPTHGVASSGTSCNATQFLSEAPAVVTGDPNMFVGIQASFADSRGNERVLVRGWRYDNAAIFGVRDLGVGLAQVQDGLVEVSDSWLFSPQVDLGDAAIVFEGDVYAYGCPGTPEYLEENCIVGRATLDEIDDSTAWRVLGEHGWGNGPPVRVFGSGPHRGPVFADPRGQGFIHVYAIGFGTSLQITRSPRPEGPWSAPEDLAHCVLPDQDPQAYCAGPVIYQELWDPFEPNQLIVGYSIGTTADNGEDLRRETPSAYRPRIVKLDF